MVCARVEIFGRVIASNLVDQLHSADLVASKRGIKFGDCYAF